jgi:hypothetical protein
MAWYRARFGTCDQILLPVWRLLSCSCGAPSLRRGWVCSLQCNHSMVRVTQNRNHTLLSHLRLPQLGGPGSHIYIPQEQGGPVKPPGTGLPLRHLLQLTGLVELVSGVTGPQYADKCSWIWGSELVQGSSGFSVSFQLIMRWNLVFCILLCVLNQVQGFLSSATLFQ